MKQEYVLKEMDDLVLCVSISLYGTDWISPSLFWAAFYAPSYRKLSLDSSFEAYGLSTIEFSLEPDYIAVWPTPDVDS